MTEKLGFLLFLSDPWYTKLQKDPLSGQEGKQAKNKVIPKVQF